MTPAAIHLAGEALLLDPAGGVVWPARRLLAVADLHLEKATAAAERGWLLPPWDSAATLARLAELIARHRPQTVLALGDSFHDRRGAARLAPESLHLLSVIADAARLVWIAGNHDPAPPEGLPGEAVACWRAGPLCFRHQASAAPPGTGLGEISGHFHPKARIAARGAALARRCFVVDARRLLLPAFGSYAGGLDVRHPAIGALFPEGGATFLLGAARLFNFPLPPPTLRIQADGILL